MPRLSSPPAAVFFDLDGTLADTADDLAAPVNQMRLDRGLKPLPLAEYRPFASEGSRALIQVGLGATPDDPGYQALRDEFLASYADNIAVHTRLFAGMPEVLHYLETNGIRWGVISNKLEYLVQLLCNALGLLPRMAVAYGGDSAPRAKPHPDLMEKALKATGLRGHQCIYIGDDLRDITAGKAVGMTTIAAGWGYASPENAASWKADYLFQHPTELIDLIEAVR
ncbi:MAG: HAD-IA family hydrolase [Lautropia sp.]|nr:HAD-IA family hydrolase [Lautropia sp.]